MLQLLVLKPPKKLLGFFPTRFHLTGILDNNVIKYDDYRFINYLVKCLNTCTLLSHTPFSTGCVIKASVLQP